MSSSIDGKTGNPVGAGADGGLQQHLGMVLDSLDAAVYVACMETYELLFLNAYGREHWGEPRGRRCWEVLQKGQTGPCPFCTNSKLVNEHGEPAPAHVWEFQNSATGRWYQCRDQAMRWPDGRLVRVEIATDITERKTIEQELNLAKERAELLARTDELTGLFNRRAFFEQGELLLRQSAGNDRHVGAIMFDVDHFKRINDQYGHDVGDAVLKAIAETVKPVVRASDVLGRVGGEEFAIVLAEADMPRTLQVAERIRAAVEALAVTHAGERISCSCSCGAVAAKGGTVTLDQLLSLADRALLTAKRSGRNQVRPAST